ncbi:hypothetical protein ILUMI_02594 [Ignelater luminosus]|uniref:PiggyBac transposable element-derived protein domain-containing protein n=1 Tax=Ignelater luminosus TaxID=2038154 RepID=A0A8K0DCG8_IGNLU|nr:hypothetical protein ILUMI_02594 [Ignelater luminosus]
MSLGSSRFFTTVKLLQSLEYSALGTCISTRKNVRKIQEKLSRGESSFRCTADGLLFVKWQDTKEVLLMSNFHNTNVTTVTKTMRDGSKSQVSCPQMIAFYHEKMEGVDIADQMPGVHDLDRKSTKW